jgi:2-keto-3-deoxy-L-rhamnonate aldolase RhmA
MSKPKRATWREFVEWVVENREEFVPRAVRGVEMSAGFVRTEREAIAALMGCGVRPVYIDGIVDDWRDVLESQGIEPPADPPSVADALNGVADEVANAGKTFYSDLSGEDARRMALAFGCAVAIVRSKAKEFT